MIDVPVFADVQAAAALVRPHVHRTPVVTSSYLNAETSATVYLKAENLQKVGAFKARGAVNAVLSLQDADAERGVVTHSSGNHGQAIAYACSIRGISATVVMPDHAPAIKVDAVRGYGATVMLCPHSDRAATVSRLAADHGYVEIHPFDNFHVIAGQATATLELMEEAPDLEIIVAPIGGGGLLSGASIVASQLGGEVVGAEPEVVDDAFRSLRDGVRYPATGALSVGDGLLTGIGEIAFAILSRAGRSVFTVTENEIIAAMHMFVQRTKLVIEPSAATAVAALLRYPDVFAGRRVGVILSGGNVELLYFVAPTADEV